MKKIITINKFLLLLLSIFSLACNNTSDKIEAETSKVKVDKFQSVLDSIYNTTPESVGILVHIESPEHNLSWSGSVGYSEKNSKTELSADQPALIASSIKTYVSATVLRLQEEAKLSIEDGIGQYLTEKTTSLFESDGYDFDKIKIRHLLSHTSGIVDYANQDYLDFINNNKTYRWTRDEQLQRAVNVGEPLGKPQEVFNYADTNYLLATEIIEQVTKKPFYSAMKELLKYEELGFWNTWFPTLEDQPKNSKELVHQYWSEKDWDSKDIDISVDLYGGGGIATTTKESAQFFHDLFNGKIIEDKAILNLLSNPVKTLGGQEIDYGLGLSLGETNGFQRVGHGGFWGTQVLYFPKLNSTISVFVLEKDVKNEVIKNTIQALVTELANQIYLEKTIITEEYALYKAKEAKSTLILFPGGGATSKETKTEFDIINLANANNISVLMMNFNRHLWIDKTQAKELSEELEGIFKTNSLKPQNVVIGGMSIGGNVALSLSNYLIENNKSFAPKGVFIVDSPIDLYGLYKSSIKDISNPNLDEERLAEPKWIVSFFEEEFSTASLVDNIQKVSPFTNESDYSSVRNLKNTKLRFYTEPDTLWHKTFRQTDFESTNAYAIQQIAKSLNAKQWTNFELIETNNKGYRSNGERHPHSWSIVDKSELINWILE